MTLYKRLGGEPAMQAAVKNFYQRILADDSISSFFDETDMDQQVSKQKAFLTMVTGGPNSYTGLDMTAGHSELVERGLDDAHVDAVVGHLAATLHSLGVAEDDISEVKALAESLRDDVLGR